VETIFRYQQRILLDAAQGGIAPRIGAGIHLMGNSTSAARTIALVISDLAPGGAERQVLEIARNLDPARFRVLVVTLSTLVPLIDAEPALRDRLRIVAKRNRFDFTVPFRLAMLFRRERVVVAHAFLFDAELSVRLAGLMAGVRAVAGSERNADYPVAPLRKALLRATRGLVRVVVANSESGARYNRRLYGLPESRYRIVYNGVDTQRFRPAERSACRARLDLPESEFVIGMFASFKRQKNHPLIIAAMEKVVRDIPNARLLLVGDVLDGAFGDTDTYKREVTDALAGCSAKHRISMLGRRNDPENIYPACDVSVLPSLHEGTPNVVLESMACGIAAVVTDVSDNARIIRDGMDGFVVPNGDVNAMADRLVRVGRDPALRDRMGRNSRDSAIERFATAAMAANMGRVYEELVN
jgi:glycosyltransferase involved in cell wall biosynthesis